MMLNPNWIGSWSTYCARFSNHSRLACAARCVESTTALRSSSYAASAAATESSSCRQAARVSASSIASLVPEPIEKCAVCAASPSSTTLSCTQCSLRTVVKLIQRELFAITSCPSSTSANSSRILSIDFWSDSPGSPGTVGVLAEAGGLPDRRRHLHDEGAAGRVERVAVDLHDAVRRLRDVELERLEHLVGAEPHVAAVAHVERGPERVGVPRAHRRVEAVGRDHQVVRRSELLDAGSLGAEVHSHVERRAPGLQDLQQPTPATSPRSRARRWSPPRP